MMDMAAHGGDSLDDARRARRNRFLMGLARGIAGALLFALPMLMTMEMWFLGFYMGRDRLLLLMLLNIPLLVVLAHRIGFERTVSWREAARDATVAYGIGIVSSALILTVFGLLKGDMPGTEIVGKIALQAFPPASAPCSVAVSWQAMPMMTTTRTNPRNADHLSR